MNTNLASVETQETKKCAGCQYPKPLSAFGRNAANDNAGACDGLNIRCRGCVNIKIAEHRQNLREYKARVRPQIVLPKRKPNMTARGYKRAFRSQTKDATPEQKILLAIQAGAKTQGEIRRIASLSRDEVSDGLAVLILDLHKLQLEPMPESERLRWAGENWKYIAA